MLHLLYNWKPGRIIITAALLGTGVETFLRPAISAQQQNSNILWGIGWIVVGLLEGWRTLAVYGKADSTPPTYILATLIISIGVYSIFEDNLVSGGLVIIFFGGLMIYLDYKKKQKASEKEALDEYQHPTDSPIDKGPAFKSQDYGPR